MTDARRLRSFVERIESLEKEIKDRNSDKRDVYGEAKDADFDPQAVKDLVAYRRNPTKAEKRSEKFDEYFGLLHSGGPNNAPARNSSPTEGHPTKPSRARARDEKPKGQSAEQNARSAPVATAGDLGDGEPSQSNSSVGTPLQGRPSHATGHASQASVPSGVTPANKADTARVDRLEGQDNGAGNNSNAPAISAPSDSRAAATSNIGVAATVSEPIPDFMRREPDAPHWKALQT